METGALSHLKVLDLSQGIAGAYTAKLLAGFGAEVIKLEPPGTGDRMRLVGPFQGGARDIECSVAFLWLNTRKMSVTVDLQNQKDREAVAELAATVDVLIESFPPGTLGKQFGFAPDRLLAINPRLVITSISGFGQTGTYRHFKTTDIVEYAMSGLMYLTGNPDRPPLCASPAVTQYTAGMNAYIATLLALYQRERTGRGQLIDVSVQESALENIEVAFTEYLHDGKIAKRTGDEHALVPWQLLPCRDGHAAVIGGPVRKWLLAADLFEEPQLFEEKYRHMRDRIAHRHELKELLRPWLERHDPRTVYHAGQQRQLAFGYLADLADVLESSQHLARSFFVEIEHPVAGRHRYCGAPFRLAEGGWDNGRAPLLGEHNELLARPRRRVPGTPEAAASDAGAAPAGGAAGPVPKEFPLAGTRVIDLTHDWAGPHATRLLADFGAEVIKIEYPRRLDGMRGAKLEDRAYDRHPRWLEINRNKLSVTLDLKTAKGVSAFQELTRISDVVVESSRVGVLERLGLGYDELKAIKPDLVLVRMSPFGQTGPEAGYSGYGGCLEPLSGVQGLTGYDNASPPRRIREMDVTNGILGACAIMTALIYRQRTGRGQMVDLSQLETATAGLIGDYLLEYVTTGQRIPRLGNRHRYMAPHGCYPCAGDDKWVVIAIGGNEEWARLCEVIGRPDLTAALGSAAARASAHDDIDRIIESWTMQRTHYNAMHELQSAQIPAGAVLTVAELATDPHLVARGFVGPAADGTPGTFPGLPFRLSEGRGEVRRRGPSLGEHNHYVFRGLLGWPEEEIEPVDQNLIGTAFDPLPPPAPLG